MTVVNTETGELIEPMTADDARRLTERIRYAAANYTEAKAKVLALVDEAKAGSAHVALGYKSWTAYLSDVLSEEPLRLARDERREMVVRLTAEGMSTRAIAPIVGAHHSTVADDIEASAVGDPTVESDAPVVRTITGLDGSERTTVIAGRTKKTTPATGTERAHQEAELVNAFRQTVRPLLTPKNVAGLSPKARTLLIDLFENAIQALKEEDR